MTHAELRAKIEALCEYRYKLPPSDNGYGLLDAMIDSYRAQLAALGPEPDDTAIPRIQDGDAGVILARLWNREITPGKAYELLAAQPTEPEPEPEPVIQAPSGVRSEVAAFAVLMERKLRENDHKPGWKKEHPLAMLSRLNEEVYELGRAFNAPPFDRLNVFDESVDVANFCMMLIDCMGGLEVAPEPVNNTDIAIDAAWCDGAKFGWNCAQYAELGPASMATSAQREKFDAAAKAARERYDAAVNPRLEAIREARKALGPEPALPWTPRERRLAKVAKGVLDWLEGGQQEYAGARYTCPCCHLMIRQEGNHEAECWSHELRAALADTPPPDARDEALEVDDKYPCAKCGKKRTRAEGGHTFTVCDDCWDVPSKPEPRDEALERGGK